MCLAVGALPMQQETALPLFTGSSLATYGNSAQRTISALLFTVSEPFLAHPYLHECRIPINAEAKLADELCHWVGCLACGQKVSTLSKPRIFAGSGNAVAKVSMPCN